MPGVPRAEHEQDPDRLRVRQRPADHPVDPHESWPFGHDSCVSVSGRDSCVARSRWCADAGSPYSVGFSGKMGPSSRHAFIRARIAAQRLLARCATAGVRPRGCGWRGSVGRRLRSLVLLGVCAAPSQPGFLLVFSDRYSIVSVATIHVEAQSSPSRPFSFPLEVVQQAPFPFGNFMLRNPLRVGQPF